jgi:arabinose-5-phosphate isomerase
MLKELFQNYQKHLNVFFDRIDLKAAQQIYELFLSCEGMLIFSGVGKSGIIAEKLAMTMISTGTKALHLPPMNALHGDIGILSEKDVMVFISKSGESEELLNLVPFVKKRGTKTVAWVSNPHSKLLKACDLGICLPFEKELCPFGLAPTTSTAVQLIFGDVLSVALMQAKKFSLADYACNHPAGTLGKKITLKVKDLMLTGSDLPLCSKEDRLRKVLVELTNKKCGCILVVDKEKRVEGIFTDGDLRRALQKQTFKVLEKKMQDLMTPSFLSTSQEQLAWNALRLMERSSRRVMMLPVIEEERLVGLIHMHDILQAGISS